MNKVPVLLVTGFLGSGKTTLLHQIARSHPDWRIVFLVNEIANTSVDGKALQQTGTPTQSVVGGSLFCECKASDFIRVMKTKVLPMHHEDNLDAVIIETSGMADPEAIGKLMEDFSLSDHYEIHSIITVAAAGSILKLMNNLDVIKAQLCASNWIILNKSDLFDEATINTAKEKIQAINPSAEISCTERCQTDIDLKKRIKALPLGELSTCDSNPFSTYTLNSNRVISYTVLEEWIQEMPDYVVRVKGTLNTDRGALVIDKTVDHMELKLTDHATDKELVVIVPDEHEDYLDTLKLPA